MDEPASHSTDSQSDQERHAPHPGSKQMPRWNLGELPEAPIFTRKNWVSLIGPGLLMGGLAIGGGEWLTGPIITAKFGGGMMWLALLSILGQVLYNIEISRYTLYTGEPIFTGKFRTLPGPQFWVFVYVLLDFGMFFPYLAASASTPVMAFWLGEVPDPEEHKVALRVLSTVILLASLIPLVIGGKIYNVLKAIMAFKIVVVFGFLLFVAIFFSRPSTWVEITSGFFKIGNVPIKRGEDFNKNGILDVHLGEDWDSDGHLDVVETDSNKNGRLDPEEDVDGDGHRDGDNLDNVFVALLQGRPLPHVDLTMLAFLCTLVAISGGGGLGNTPISNYTRDQGWGMGAHVGAIPSIVGGHNIQLSHVGTVFEVTSEALLRWRKWYHHVRRDQLAVWLPACLLGVALPSMLSLEFLPRGTEAASQWSASVLTAQALRDHIGPRWGYFFWFMSIFCGFLVLGVSIGPAADGFVRRWVDVFWTSSKRLRSLDPRSIRYVYFSMLAVYAIIGVTMLWVARPTTLLLIAGMILNFALGISCWHTLAVNLIILPRALRPGWFIRIGLFLVGLFFLSVATVTTIVTLTQEEYF